jgi:hypothetical protein
MHSVFLFRAGEKHDEFVTASTHARSQRGCRVGNPSKDEIDGVVPECAFPLLNLSQSMIRSVLSHSFCALLRANTSAF